MTLVNEFASYDLEGPDFGRSVSVGLGSTPEAEEAGVALNPIMEQSPRDLVTGSVGEQFLQQMDLSADWSRGPKEVATEEGSLFGSQVTHQTFAGVTGDGDFALLDVLKTGHEGDVVLVGDSRTMDVDAGGPITIGEDGYVTRATVDASREMFAELLPLVLYGQVPNLG